MPPKTTTVGALLRGRGANDVSGRRRLRSQSPPAPARPMPSRSSSSSRMRSWLRLGLGNGPTFLGSALLVGPMAWGGWFNARKDPDPIRRGRFCPGLVIAGATGGVLFVLLAGLIRGLARIESLDLMATFAAPLASWWSPRSLPRGSSPQDDSTRRNGRVRARLSALGTLRALTWDRVMATILYVPGLLIASGPWVRTAVASGWRGRPYSESSRPSHRARRRRCCAVSLTTLAAMAWCVFLVGLVGLVSFWPRSWRTRPRRSLPVARPESLGTTTSWASRERRHSF